MASSSSSLPKRSVLRMERPIVIRDFPVFKHSDHARGRRVERESKVLPRLVPDMLNFVNPRNAASILFMGPSGGGKSVLLREFLYGMRNHVDAAVFINGSEGMNQDFEGIFPRLYDSDSLTPHHLEQLYLTQKRHIKEVREWNEHHPDRPRRFKSLLVLFDDVGFDNAVQNQKNFKKLFTNGRNYHIFVMSSYQDWVQAPTVVRQNCQILCMASNMNDHRCKMITTEVVNRFTEQQLSHTLEQLRAVNPYIALAFVRQPDRILAPGTTERVKQVQKVQYHPSDMMSGFFWAMSSPCDKRPFRLGSPAYWYTSEVMYNPSWDDEEREESDPAGVYGKVVEQAAAQGGCGGGTATRARRGRQ